MKPINIAKKHELFKNTWHPHQIAVVDNMQVLLAKLQGEFVWHSHDHEDELFQVLKGTLYIEFRDKIEVIQPGEIIVVPKGVEHRPFTKNNTIVEVLLFEKLSTLHTGTIQHEKTQTEYPRI